jgi:DNA-binding CsgD family transcriptional regulator
MDENTLFDILDRLSAARAPEDLWQAATAIFSDFGSEWVTFGSKLSGGLPIIRTTVSAALMADYMAVNLHRYDPWLDHCIGSTLIDDLVVGSARPHDVGYPVQQVFADHALRHASLFPCSLASEAAGIVLYSRSRDSTEWLTCLPGRAQLRLLVALVSSRFRPYDSDPNAAGYYGETMRLSQQQEEVLCWLARGHDTAAIAVRMKLAPVTVTKHLSAARRRLRARTREQALAIALTYKLIHV